MTVQEYLDAPWRKKVGYRVIRNPFAMLLIGLMLVLFFGTSAGVWLFYIQHNFEGVYWERRAQWNYFKASLRGSSFYKLPVLLQWFSGNIGFHHIHHLGSKIPNYYLPKAYKENPFFQVRPLTLLSSLKCLKWRWYDEVNRRMAGWDALQQYRKKIASA